VAYVDNALNRAEDGGHRLANEGNLGEDSSLADQDVEQGLMDPDELRWVSMQLGKYG
jgi:hypothetical protein